MKNRVFVVDRHHDPLMPCSAKRARLLLQRGRARVHRFKPFTIRLVDRLQASSALQPVTVKIDPGSRYTGIVVARGADRRFTHLHGLFLMELEHRGLRIAAALRQRAALRRNRRSRKTRYRPVRFSNRTRPAGWLAPSLLHRVQSTLTWVQRLRRWVPVTALAQELVRFDTQRMQNPEISGVEYQQGTLLGYEIREYLMAKYRGCCVYCGRNAKDVEIQIDHVRPRARGGSNRVSNLVLACWRCNQSKGARPVEEFLSGRPEALKRVLAGLRQPLRDAAAVNATRWCLYRRLLGTGLPVQTGSGAQTKWNRTRFGLPKTHALDALCVGEVVSVADTQGHAMPVQCAGRGLYQRTITDRFGFPSRHRMRQKLVSGFKGGDICSTVISLRRPKAMLGHITLRLRGVFSFYDISSKLPHDRNFRFLRRVAISDGFRYFTKKGDL